jgi:hypothetical protein
VNVATQRRDAFPADTLQIESFTSLLTMLPRWVKSIHVAWYQSIGRATQLLRRFGYGGFQKWYPKSSKPVDHDLYILKPMVLGIPPFKKLHRERHSWQREVPICNGHRPWRISADGWKANAWLKEKIELGKTRIILTSSKISPTLIILIIIITTITIIIINILNIVRIINILIIIIILLLLLIFIYISFYDFGSLSVFPHVFVLIRL